MARQHELTADSLWTEVSDRLKGALNDTTFGTWFGDVSARELNERGELAPLDYQRQRAGKPLKGGKWSNAHLRQQLRSKAMLGHATHEGITVRDEDGFPVLKSKTPLIDQEKFDRLQTAMDARSFKVSTRSAGASPLLGVAFCGIKLHRPGCEHGSDPYCGPVCDCEVCGKPSW